jgi:hypothetical protein
MPRKVSGAPPWARRDAGPGLVVACWQDAEQAAAQWLKWLGCEDASAQEQGRRGRTCHRCRRAGEVAKHPGRTAPDPATLRCGNRRGCSADLLFVLRLHAAGRSMGVTSWRCTPLAGSEQAAFARWVRQLEAWSTSPWHPGPPSHASPRMTLISGPWNSWGGSALRWNEARGLRTHLAMTCKRRSCSWSTEPSRVSPRRRGKESTQHVSCFDTRSRAMLTGPLRCFAFEGGCPQEHRLPTSSAVDPKVVDASHTARGWRAR